MQKNPNRAPGAPDANPASLRRAVLGAVGGVAILFAVLAWYLVGRDPAPANASAPATVGIEVGNVVPDFRVADSRGGVVTRASLVDGKPGLIFFTATWCTPCIKGLAALAAFQQDVGGSPFNVLVVFVDPRETDEDLRAYRERFRFPESWHYAIDRDAMARRYALRYLDTKYVLDTRGVIKYTDFAAANYDTWVRALATVGIAPR